MECFPEGERNFRRSASDELKENSGSEFKKEEVYQTYSDIENNELTCFHDTLSRSGRYSFKYYSQTFTGLIVYWPS